MRTSVSGVAGIACDARRVRFADALGAPSMSEADDSFAVVVEPSGLCFEAPIGVPLLRAAREAGLILPSSCRNGTCRACLCRMVSGRVRYTVEWPGLSAEEKAEGFILPCVAIAESPLVLEAPRAVSLGDPA